MIYNYSSRHEHHQVTCAHTGVVDIRSLLANDKLPHKEGSACMKEAIDCNILEQANEKILVSSPNFTHLLMISII